MAIYCTTFPSTRPSLNFLVHPAFMWGLPKIRASPNFQATPQAGAAIAAPYDSSEGGTHEPRQDQKVLGAL